MKDTITDLRIICGWTGLKFFTYSPGDGVTRYRFFAPDNPADDYFGGSNPLFTALGIKEAIIFASGFHAGNNGR